MGTQRPICWAAAALFGVVATPGHAADCVTSEDLWDGIALTHASGLRVEYRRLSDTTWTEVYRDIDFVSRNLYMGALFPVNSRMTRRWFQPRSGEDFLNTTYRYRQTVNQLPRPVPETETRVWVDVEAMDGKALELHVYRFGAANTVAFGGCHYRSVPVSVYWGAPEQVTDEPEANLTLYYLSELGIALFVDGEPGGVGQGIPPGSTLTRLQ